MKSSQLNQYYQCNDRGYVKLDNVKVDHLPIISEIPISARCNQILPYKLHKIQVLDPVQVSQVKALPKETIRQMQTLPRNTNIKKQTSLNYSFSVSSLGNNPIKMLEKDEVRSIHIDDKTSARTKIQERQKDLTKSTFTYLNKPKVDMKRSLFETNQSFYTNDTSNKDNQKLDMIVNELVKEKKKREEFQKKYEILFNLVNKQNNTHSQEPYYEGTLSPQQSPNPKYTKYSNRNKNLNVKSVTESSEESQTQSPVMINYGRSKSKRKCSSPSPIIINLGSQILGRSPLKSQHNIPKSEEQLSDLNDIKGSLQMIQNEVAILNQNVDFLDKKIDEQQMKRQKQALLKELRDKQERIQQMAKENQKIKQINQLLIIKKAQPQKNQKSQYSVNLKIEKNTILTSFIISLLMALVFLALRGTICQ